MYPRLKSPRKGLISKKFTNESLFSLLDFSLCDIENHVRYIHASFLVKLNQILTNYQIIDFKTPKIEPFLSTTKQLPYFFLIA